MNDHEVQAGNEPEIVDITITAPDADWLRQHCAMLIEMHLAASANVIPAVDSIYRWRGSIHHATEAYAVIHTQMTHVDAIVDLTCSAHPYDTVHVQARLIDSGNPDYLHWIAASTDHHRTTDSKWAQ